MKRVLAAAALAGLFSACVHPWVGRSVTQLEREMGRPLSIQNAGANRVFIYPDTLAGYGQMRFTVDSSGIIRSWDATTNVPGPFGGDVFGVNDPGGGLPIP